MDLDRQLLPSQLDGANWGLLDHVYRGPQLALSNYYIVINNMNVYVRGHYLICLTYLKVRIVPL